MEFTSTTTQDETNSFGYADFDGNRQTVEERLETLAALNEVYDRQAEIFSSDAEQAEAESMKTPYSLTKAFSIFGLLLGTLPPAAIITKIFSESGGSIFDEPLMIGLFVVANVVSASVGYFTGGLIGKLTFEMEKLPWHLMLISLPFLGMLWGIISGGAGGLFLFVFGAVFGAVIGGLVGSAALTMFGILHRLLKRGDQIERKHFMPIAFGIALLISAFILGM